MELLDRAVMETLERDILRPAIIVRAIEKALQQLQHCEDDNLTPDAKSA